jgi:uncharacterized membrane protein
MPLIISVIVGVLLAGGGFIINANNFELILRIILIGLVFCLFFLDSHTISALQKEAYGDKPRRALKELKKLRPEVDRRKKENEEKPHYL